MAQKPVECFLKMNFGKSLSVPICSIRSMCFLTVKVKRKVIITGFVSFATNEMIAVLLLLFFFLLVP